MSTSVIDRETLDVLDDLFENGLYLSELLPPFRAQISNAQIGLESAVSAYDGKAVVFHAHGLKSSSAQLGALRVSGVCQLLETLAAKPDWDEIVAAMVVLKAEAADAVCELSQIETRRRMASA